MIRIPRWIPILVVVASCSRIPGAAEAKPRGSGSTGIGSEPAPVAPLSGAAAVFQRSYDEEAGGRLDEAIKALDTLPPSQKDSYFAQYRRGWLLYRLGHHADSISFYGKAIALEPDSIEARVGALFPQLAVRRWHDAETTAREVLARDPANHSATLRLAFALYSQARFSDAEKLYRHLLSTYPSDTEVRNGLGWALLKLGKRDEAHRLFKEVLEIAPRSPLAVDGLRAIKSGT